MNINPRNEDLCVNVFISYVIKNTGKILDKLEICGEMVSYRVLVK